MTIVLEISPEAQAEIVRQATAQGRAKEEVAASLLEEAVILHTRSQQRVIDLGRAQSAGARMRELSKGLTLGDITIRELIDEGRK